MNVLASDGFYVSSAGNDGAKLLCQILAKLAELEGIPSTTSELHHQAPEVGARVDLRDHLQPMAGENSLDLQQATYLQSIQTFSSLLLIGGYLLLGFYMSAATQLDTSFMRSAPLATLLSTLKRTLP